MNENSSRIQTPWILLEFFTLLFKPSQLNATVILGFGSYWVDFIDSIWVLPGGVYWLITLPSHSLWLNLITPRLWPKPGRSGSPIWSIEDLPITWLFYLLPLRLCSMPKWFFSSSHIITQFSQVSCGHWAAWWQSQTHQRPTRNGEASFLEVCQEALHYDQCQSHLACGLGRTGCSIPIHHGDKPIQQES